MQLARGWVPVSSQQRQVSWPLAGARGTSPGGTRVGRGRSCALAEGHRPWGYRSCPPKSHGHVQTTYWGQSLTHANSRAVLGNAVGSIWWPGQKVSGAVLRAGGRDSRVPLPVPWFRL